MPDETTEEFAPFFARELRENWLKNVASASAMWMRIEDFILELERLEEMAYTGHYLSKAKEMKSRLSTLELRFRETSRASEYSRTQIPRDFPGVLKRRRPSSPGYRFTIDCFDYLQG